MSRLTLVVADEQAELHPGAQLVFGRMGDFPIDENPHLHRHLGQLYDLNGQWYLRNIGSSIEMAGQWSDGRRFTLPSDAIMALDGSAASIWFSAGRARYEVMVTIGDAPPPAPSAPIAAPSGGVDTTATGDVAINDEQRLMLVALARRRLEDPSAPIYDLPSAGEAAAMLGWPVTKYRRKLDYLCSRLAEAGVDGVYGGTGANASTRQIVLVEHALSRGLVTLDHLRLLDG